MKPRRLTFALTLALALTGAWAHIKAQAPAPSPNIQVQMETPLQKFIPSDVDFAHPAYVNKFTDPATLADWSMETDGPSEAIIADGRLTLKNGSGPDGLTDAKPLVFWLRKEMPSDFLLEFDFTPHDRTEGLAIVFFSARGRQGQSIFDPALKKRNGNFKQYHSGDLDNYHISYWSGGTRAHEKGGGQPHANLRKNFGFQLVASGPDLVVPGAQGKPQKIRIYKKGPEIKLTVDDDVAISFTDDGKTFGPVIDHPGWLALRQMPHTGFATYQNLAIYPLKP